MGKKLYVGNMGYDVSSSDLEQLFAPHGTVQSAEVNDRPEERWEYGTGEKVRCRTGTLPSGERVLFAAERLDFQ